jgi:hypothetical protein
MAQKKIPFKDRISYLDEIQYEANTLPGVGTYNPHDPRVLVALCR